METLRMSQCERWRLVVISQVSSGKLTLRQASELLSVSYRQGKRIWSRYEGECESTEYWDNLVKILEAQNGA